LWSSSFARWQLLSWSKSESPGTTVPPMGPVPDGVPKQAGELFSGDVTNFGVVHIEFLWLSAGVICVPMSLWPSEGRGVWKAQGVDGSVPISFMATKWSSCFDMELENSSVAIPHKQTH
jgi:hypothetical protein